MSATYICEQCNSETDDRDRFVRHSVELHELSEREVTELADRAERGTMLCPFCREEIRIEAVICPHCTRRFASYYPNGKRKLPLWAQALITLLLIGWAMIAWNTWELYRHYGHPNNNTSITRCFDEIAKQQPQVDC